MGALLRGASAWGHGCYGLWGRGQRGPSGRGGRGGKATGRSPPRWPRRPDSPAAAEPASGAGARQAASSRNSVRGCGKPPTTRWLRPAHQLIPHTRSCLLPRPPQGNSRRGGGAAYESTHGVS